MAVVGDVVIGSGGGAFLGLDARSGAERWRLPYEEQSDYVDSAVVCHRIVVALRNRLVSLRPADGQLAWDVRLTPRTSPISNLPILRAAGCDVTLLVASGSTADAPVLADSTDAGANLLMLDGSTGRSRLRVPCEAAGCAIGEATPEHVLLRRGHDASPARVVDASGGRTFAEVPANFENVVAAGTRERLGVMSHVDQMRGVRLRDAKTLWSRRCGLLARVQDDAICQCGRTIERIDLRTGRSRWTTPLGADLARSLDRATTTVASARCLLYGRFGNARVLLVLDADRGTPTALRLLPQSVLAVAAEGGTAVVAHYGATAAIDLDAEAPSLREYLSLEDDFVGSLGQLRIQPPADELLDLTPPHLYPKDARDAEEWLRRLIPLLGDRLLAVADRADFAQLVSLAPVIAADDRPQATRALLALLRRAYAPEPTIEVARAREAIANALHGVLGRDDANRLAEESVGWLQGLDQTGGIARLRRGACATGERECERALEVLAAVRAVRSAIERTSSSAAPLVTFAQTTRGLAERPAPLSCAPTDAEAAQLAALRHVYELSIDSPQVVVTGRPCLSLQTLAGPLRLVSCLDAVGFGVVEVQPTVSHEDDQVYDRSDPAWRGAALQAVYMRQAASANCGHRDWFLLRKVDGEWRVVGERVPYSYW